MSFNIPIYSCDRDCKVPNGQMIGRQGTETGSETNGGRFTEIPGNTYCGGKLMVDINS